ncbi:helix-turn-helix domain-containing protein [Hymenobacter norwichensis]|uniref:helix-turn-helix domain-containing protein n=1 Tax=Hymenobacter norwichensis TaxID=223903 RepID=UPI0003B5423E
MPALITSGVEYSQVLIDVEDIFQKVFNQIIAQGPALPEVGGIELAQEITRLSKPRIYALVSARGIPHAKRGNKLHFHRAELLKWINNGRRNEETGPSIYTAKQGRRRKTAQ